MPPTSNPPSPNQPPGRMPRLLRASRSLKLLTTLILLTLLCAYARTALRYGNPHPQTTASLSHSFTQTLFNPPPTRTPHRRHTFFRPVRQSRRHTRRTTPYYLASLRHLRRLVSQLLVVRS